MLISSILEGALKRQIAIVSALLITSACDAGTYPQIIGYRANPDYSVCKIVQTDLFHKHEECGSPPYVPPPTVYKPSDLLEPSATPVQQQGTNLPLQEQSQFAKPNQYQYNEPPPSRQLNIPPAQEYQRQPSA